jgi:hypothetical protein
MEKNWKNYKLLGALALGSCLLFSTASEAQGPKGIRVKQAMPVPRAHVHPHAWRGGRSVGWHPRIRHPGNRFHRGLRHHRHHHRGVTVIR